jgi:hypothetical protein
MHLSNTESNVVTVVLCHEDLHLDLVEKILEDCRHAGEFSSYLTSSQLIFNRADLASEEPCMVVALPGITSDRIPSTTKLPEPVTLRKDGEGATYLMLRDGQVLLNTYRLPISPSTSRYLLLYLFDETSALDIIPFTEGLEHDIWIHQMHAQSWIRVCSAQPESMLNFGQKLRLRHEIPQHPTGH